jgi:integrase
VSAKPKRGRVGACLFRKVDGGKIYARVRDKGRLTWKSTETAKAADARKWLAKWRRDSWLIRNGIEPQGVTLQRGRVTVGEILDAYTQAGCPTRKMQTKSAETIVRELRFAKPVRRYLGDTPAAALTLGDCDRFRDWRLKGGYVTERKLRDGKTREHKTKGGKRAVDLELGILSNALNHAERRGVIKSNPITKRGRYTNADEVRHCREVAPTPEGLQKIVGWLRGRKETAIADLVAFLAYSGLRIGEALPLTWQGVNLAEGLVNVKREKRGVNPWVAILPEMETLLRDMAERATSPLLFPSPFEPSKPRDASAVRHRITSAIAALNKTAEKEGKPKLGHVTPHGLRSYFVTQARQSGLTDAEIAMLIGDKTGPAIIAHTYGDLRPDHLLAQARRIRLTVTAGDETPAAASSHRSSHTLPQVDSVFHSDNLSKQAA